MVETIGDRHSSVREERQVPGKAAWIGEAPQRHPCAEDAPPAVALKPVARQASARIEHAMEARLQLGEATVRLAAADRHVRLDDAAAAGVGEGRVAIHPELPGQPAVQATRRLQVADGAAGVVPCPLGLGRHHSAQSVPMDVMRQGLSGPVVAPGRW